VSIRTTEVDIGISVSGLSNVHANVKSRPKARNLPHFSCCKLLVCR
jgi:hypothetical protein